MLEIGTSFHRPASPASPCITIPLTSSCSWMNSYRTNYAAQCFLQFLSDRVGRLDYYSSIYWSSSSPCCWSFSAPAPFHFSCSCQSQVGTSRPPAWTSPLQLFLFAVAFFLHCFGDWICAYLLYGRVDRDLCWYFWPVSFRFMPWLLWRFAGIRALFCNLDLFWPVFARVIVNCLENGQRLLG